VAKLNTYFMNTQFKVGQKVRVITASTGTDLNVSGWVGEIIEVQSDNFIGIRFENYPLLYCFSDEDITLNVEILHHDTDKPVMWRKIDANDIPTDVLLCANEDKSKIVINRIGVNALDGTIQSHNRREFFEVAHYIPLSELINLPIQP
jgi:hypothetical protein